MFSSCVSNEQGFSFRKPWRERFFRCFSLFSAPPGCLSSFTRRSSEEHRPQQRGGLSLAPCSTFLHEGLEPHTSNRAQGGHMVRKCVRGDRNETCRLWSVQRLRLEMLVGNLVPAFLGRDPSYFPHILGHLQGFWYPQQVLELLFTMYGCILPYCNEDGGPL
ncbi:unnamed protein product, partial [Rangifer tarandus platyrhynchus]